jgi:hypothetical protein
MVQYNNIRLETETISGAGWLAVALVFLTGVLHVYAGVVEGRIPVALAGVGFLAAIGLYVIDYRRRVLYLAGILYTAVQIPIWYVVKAGAYTPVGYVDKAIQVALIVLLAYLYLESRAAAETVGDESRAKQVG